MKKTGPIRAGGLYLDHNGFWQSAVLMTDGRALLEIGDSAETVSPMIPQCELLGLNAGQGIEVPLDPEKIAQEHNITVVSDLRQSDIAFGGRGGPLTPFYLHALARYREEPEPLVFLEIGEVSKVTWVDPNLKAPEDPSALLAFEAGPGLSVLNRLYESRTDRVVQSGKVEDGALELFMQDPYFRRVAPKWLDEDSFESMLALVFELSDADAESTICGMIATAILLATEHFPRPAAKYVVMGLTSEHNHLLDIIKSGLSASMVLGQEWGLNAATVKAQSTAYLAVRALYGLATTAPTTTGVKAAIGGATLSHRDGN